MSKAASLATWGPTCTHDMFEADCPLRGIMSDVTGRWTTLVVAALIEEPHRFAALAARIEGVSDKMLAQTLRVLTRDGLVSRTVAPTVPIQVTYALTDLGRELAPLLLGLVRWADQQSAAIQAARAAYDADVPPSPATANRR